MEDTLRESLKTPEIKKKILFSILIVSILCLLTIVPIPGLSHAAATAKIEDWGTTGTLIDILSCGALTNASIVSLGIFPFLVASIVMQIVTLAVPKLRDLAQMGGEGTKRITKYTRIASLIGAGVFAGCSSLTTVTLGSGLKSVENQSFAYCQELSDVFCHAVVVPCALADAFKDSYIEHTTLHVPAVSLADYKAAKPWSEFKNVVTLSDDNTSISPLE